MTSSNVYCPQVRSIFERGDLHALETCEFANEEHEGEELRIVFRCQTDLWVSSCGAGAFSSKVPEFTSNLPLIHLRVKIKILSSQVVAYESSNLALPNDPSMTSLLLQLQVWRLRYYPNEKVIGAAKPLIYIKDTLSLSAGGCQRILWRILRWTVKWMVLRWVFSSVCRACLNSTKPIYLYI